MDNSTRLDAGEARQARERLACLSVPQVVDLLKKKQRDAISLEYVKSAYRCTQDEAQTVVHELTEPNWVKAAQAEEKPAKFKSPLTTRDVIEAAMWELGFIRGK